LIPIVDFILSKILSIIECHDTSRDRLDHFVLAGDSFFRGVVHR
jgi:hypothetical protein